MSEYALCPFRAHVRYDLRRWPERPSLPLSLGRILHKSIEMLYLRGFDQAVQIAQEGSTWLTTALGGYLTNGALARGQDDRLIERWQGSSEWLGEIVPRYARVYGEAQWDEVLHCEDSAWLYDEQAGIVWLLTPDLVVQDEGGMCRIIDTKSVSPRRRWTYTLEMGMSWQLALYHKWLTCMYPEREIRSPILDIIWKEPVPHEPKERNKLGRRIGRYEERLAKYKTDLWDFDKRVFQRAHIFMSPEKCDYLYNEMVGSVHLWKITERVEGAKHVQRRGIACTAFGSTCPLLEIHCAHYNAEFDPELLPETGPDYVSEARDAMQ